MPTNQEDFSRWRVGAAFGTAIVKRTMLALEAGNSAPAECVKTLTRRSK